MTETSKNGVFFDTKNQKVVKTQPEEGIQIVAPGGEITPSVQADIDRFTDAQNGTPSTPKTIGTQGSIETAADEAPVEAAADTRKTGK
jgi:hypothetical protein